VPNGETQTGDKAMESILDLFAVLLAIVGALCVFFTVLSVLADRLIPSIVRAVDRKIDQAFGEEDSQ
jgi:hypothetical protein